jgi:hypothetical protein
MQGRVVVEGEIQRLLQGFAPAPNVDKSIVATSGSAAPAAAPPIAAAAKGATTSLAGGPDGLRNVFLYLGYAHIRSCHPCLLHISIIMCALLSFRV